MRLVFSTKKPKHTFKKKIKKICSLTQICLAMQMIEPVGNFNCTSTFYPLKS